jgi:gliding motility-associated-like protein
MFDAPFILNNTSTNYNSIKWVTTLGNFTTNTINLNYQDEGDYPVKLVATNNFGCKDSIIKTIRVEPIFTFYAPNTFTPNGDKTNDLFFPLGVGWNEDKYTLYIFDRWGEMIFTSSDVRKGWEGKAKNGSDMAQQDVYIWKVELDDVFKKHHSYIGHITLLK